MAQIKQLLLGVIGTSRLICYPKLIVRYSQYPPSYVEPIFTKKDLERIRETGEDKKLAHLPIKAAKTEESSSVFYDPELEKFINYVMRKGEKELARMLVNKALEQVKRIQLEKYHKTNDPEEKAEIELDPLQVFHRAVNNCKPILKLTPIKRGGATYQVPVPISTFKARFLAMNWLIEQAKGEPKDVRFYTKLANELVYASQGQGRVIRRKEDLHRQCEANKAYAHYRWM